MKTMTETQFTEWLGRIPSLTRLQAETARSRLLLLLGENEKPAADDWLLDGICWALSEKGLLGPVSKVALLNGRAGRMYAKHAPALHTELQKLLETTGQASKRLAKESLARLCGDCLIDWCKQRFPEKMSPSLVLQNTPFIMEALDAGFPGYRRAGLFGVVLSGSFQ